VSHADAFAVVDEQFLRIVSVAGLDGDRAQRVVDAVGDLEKSVHRVLHLPCWARCDGDYFSALKEKAQALI
jgi:hypothetical protein